MITVELNWRDAMMLHTTLLIRFGNMIRNGDMPAQRTLDTAYAIVDLQANINEEIGCLSRSQWDSYLATYDNGGGREGRETAKIIRLLEKGRKDEEAFVSWMDTQRFTNYSSDA